MLRHVVGDAAFFQAQRNWYTNHQYAAGDTAAYQAEVEAAAASGSLTWFFDEWLNGLGMPNYSWAWSAANTGSGYKLYVRVDQAQVNAPIFTMPIDLDVTTASGTTRYIIQDSLHRSQRKYFTGMHRNGYFSTFNKNNMTSSFPGFGKSGIVRISDLKFMVPPCLGRARARRRLRARGPVSDRGARAPS